MSLKRVGDLVQRLVPGDARETAFAFASDAPHRMQHALIGIGALEVARDFRAQHAAVAGWSGAPRIAIARPFSTVVSSAQVSGQSCGQAPRTTRRWPADGEIERHGRQQF